MIPFQTLIDKAKSSSFYLKILNLGLNRMVPFNRPHGFRVVEIGDDHVRTKVPYRKKNTNHIRGIHACALATLSEFTTGLLLLTKLDPKSYRLIMKSLKMDYHYQAKMAAFAHFSLTDQLMERTVYLPLQSTDKVLLECTVEVYDQHGNHVSTGNICWQVKKWEKVRTNV